MRNWVCKTIPEKLKAIGEKKIRKISFKLRSSKSTWNMQHNLQSKLGQQNQRQKRFTSSELNLFSKYREKLGHWNQL